MPYLLSCLFFFSAATESAAAIPLGVAAPPPRLRGVVPESQAQIGASCAEKKAHPSRTEEMASAKADPGQEARRGMHLARRIVIKAGTPVVTHCDGKVALGRIGSLVEQVAILRQQGREVVIVSSGAIATGIERMRKTMALNQTVHETMLGARDMARAGPSAAVGQALLMNMYETMFSKYNLSCAQVLLTEDELSDGDTLSQARDTTMELLGLGTIPIINDNDAITSRSVPVMDEDTGEIRWDNDSLARPAAAVGARRETLAIPVGLMKARAPIRLTAAAVFQAVERARHWRRAGGRRAGRRFRWRRRHAAESSWMVAVATVVAVAHVFVAPLSRNWHRM